MDNNTPQPEISGFSRFSKWLSDSPTIKLIMIFFILLVMLIPLEMVKDVTRERQWTQEEATNEVSEKWGRQQQINGPVLTVPVLREVYEADVNGKYQYVKRLSFAHFLPQSLNIESDVAPEVRKRGIYEVVVYNGKYKVSGNFSHPDFSYWSDIKEIRWNEATMSIGISDLRSIHENVVAEWNGEAQTLIPGVEHVSFLGSGLSSRVNLSTKDSATDYTFNVQIELGGSNGLRFIPLGKETNVSVHSAWPSPSFQGAFLPANHEVTAQGFTANWKVLFLNRSYPQQFIDSATGVAESEFGVDLMVMVDEYKQNERAAKYAVLIIALTFMIFFFVQVLHRVNVHPLQYIMVGLALALFYLLLLSFSEQIGFNFAYLLAALAIIAMVSLYVKAIFKNAKLTWLNFTFMILIYAFVFVIIQMEEYSLLVGSIGLFLVLGLAMYLSRNISWVKGDS